MGDAYLLVSIIIVVALIFDYTNGFHDAANAIATTVETKALTPRKALAVAAIGNLVGAFISEGVAKTVGSGIVEIKPSTEGLYVVLAGVIGAIAWNMITWWFGIPSSSSHALIGGLVGAAIASREIVQWDGLLSRVAIPMILSPLIGFTLAFILTASLQGIFRNAKRSQVSKYFRAAQICSSTAMAVGHGLQDAQKTMGVMTLALVVGGFHSGDSIPTWVKISAALAIAAGTYAGGWRIMKTLGKRLVNIDQLRGVASEAVASSVLFTLAIGFKAPISTTHTITSAILGAGATRGKRAVSWTVVSRILMAWVITVPMAALSAALMVGFVHFLGFI
ncbi:MAG: inorganic phosphate transporter [Candidatus Nanopelagicaceae bacterium]|jgi:PiT family inorganic phosphate transporter